MNQQCIVISGNRRYKVTYHARLFAATILSEEDQRLVAGAFVWEGALKFVTMMTLAGGPETEADARMIFDNASEMWSLRPSQVRGFREVSH